MSELPPTPLRVITNASPAKSPSKSSSQRAVFFLPETYVANVDALAGASGIPKSEVVRKALESFFAGQGMNPDKSPRLIVEFQYDY